MSNKYEKLDDVAQPIDRADLLSLETKNIVDIPTVASPVAPALDPKVVEQRESWTRYIYLLILFFVFTCNIVDRYLIVFLYSASTAGLTPEEARHQSMKIDVGISASQFGYLSGPSFSVIMGVASIIAGWCTDRLNRKYVTLCGLVIWSVATAVTGLSNTFWHVLIARQLQALGMAFSPSLGYSMIADLFSKDQLGLANGFYSSAVYVGYGSASLCLLLIAKVGWRDTCYILGVSGAMWLVIMFFFFPHPTRARPKPVAPPVEEKKDKDTMREGLLTLTDSDMGVEAVAAPKITYLSSFIAIVKPTDMKWLVVASALRMGGGLVLGSYVPQYFKNAFPEHKNQFAIINSIVVTVAGTTSSLLGGRLADWWVARNTRRLKERTLASANSNAQLDSLHDLSPYALLPALSCLLSAPFFIGVFFIPNLYAAMAMLFVAYIFSECWFGPMFAMIQGYSAIPQVVKGMAMALLMAGTSVLASFAPVIVGYIDERYDSVQWELAFGVVGSNVVAGLCFLVVSHYQKRHAQTTAANALVSQFQ